MQPGMDAEIGVSMVDMYDKMRRIENDGRIFCTTARYIPVSNFFLPVVLTTLIFSVRLVLSLRNTDLFFVSLFLFLFCSIAASWSTGFASVEKHIGFIIQHNT